MRTEWAFGIVVVWSFFLVDITDKHPLLGIPLIAATFAFLTLEVR